MGVHFRITAFTRLMIETGIFVALLSHLFWLAGISNQGQANAKDIEDIKVEQRVLSKDLVDTQKTIIKDITEIKTTLRQRK